MLDELKLLSPQEFPTLITEISDPPKQLHLRGTLPPTGHKWLAVVGSRACTPYGRQVVQHLIAGLRGYPIAIVSGLAYGIDAEAHRAALSAGLPTVTVPGSGLDWKVLYPKANHGLAREIISANGAHLSEFNVDQTAAEWTFPRRNRVMVGLSHAVLMIEAQEKSGSLITAKLATEYNRELLVVPGSIFSESSKGTHQFLKLGATPVTEVSDILQALGISARTSDPTLLYADLSENEQRVIAALASPLTRDALIEVLGLPIIDANIILSTLEIKGIIVEQLGLMRIA
jgi:DNA processing protein